MDAGSVGILNYVTLQIKYLWWCSHFLPRGHLCRCTPCTYVYQIDRDQWDMLRNGCNVWPHFATRLAVFEVGRPGFCNGLTSLKWVDRFRNGSAFGNQVITYILYLYQHLSVTKEVLWAKSEAVVKLYKSTGIGFDAQAEIFADYRAMEASGAFRKKGSQREQAPPCLWLHIIANQLSLQVEECCCTAECKK